MKNFVIIFLLLLQCPFWMNGQSVEKCSTPAPSTPLMQNGCCQNIPTDIQIRVYFHVLRTSSGTSDITLQNVQDAFNRLTNDFTSTGISFNWNGVVNYINTPVGKDWSFFPRDIRFAEYKAIYNNPDGVDIFLVGNTLPNDNGGEASDKALVVCGAEDGYYNPINPGQETLFATSSVISHEMGHVLGLFHPFQKWGLNSNLQCPASSNYTAEYVNGTSSCECGDLVCDTPFENFAPLIPACPGTLPSCTDETCLVDCETCVYNGNPFTDPAGNVYPIPLGNNIMSVGYSNTTYCGTQFTSGQVERMKCSLCSNPVLHDAIISNLNAAFGQPFENNCIYQFTSNSQGIHTWNFGDGSNAVNLQSPTHVFPANGVYEVTHTVTDGCISDTETMAIVIFCPSIPCPCPIGTGVNINGPTTSLNNSQLPSTFTGCVAIGGVLFIDRPGLTTFNAADVTMQPGAAIVVRNGSQLAVTNSSDLHGCSAMWQGITVESGGSLSISESSYVQDACMAVNAEDGATISVKGCFFNRNLIGLFADNPFNLTIAAGITFDGANLLPPLAGQIGEAGIKISDGNSLLIGTNNFSNLRNGIVATRNSLTVNGGTFTNINFADINPASGYGIYADGGPAPFYSLAVSGGTYTDCWTGIYARAGTANVKNTVMSNVARGIISEMGAFSVDIQGNVISCLRMGIELANIQAEWCQRTIKGNTINLTGKGTGINITDSGSSDGIAVGFVESNTINVNGPQPIVGLNINNSAKLKTSSNTVNLQSNTIGGVGIFVSGGGANTIGEQNFVYGISANTGANVGYRGQSCPEVIWECNAVANTHTGFRFDNPCNTSNGFRANTMNNHKMGLNLKAGAQLGIQNQTKNQWFGTYDDMTLKGARHEGGLFEAPFSLFYVKASSYPDRPTTFPLTGWFIGPPPGTPNNNFGCASVSGGEEGTDEADLAIASNSSTGYDGNRWLSERYLYAKLRGNPQYVQPGTVFEAFRNQKSTTTVGQFYDINKDIESLFEIAPATQQVLASNYAAIGTKQADLLAIEAQLATATGTSQENLMAQKRALLQEVDVLDGSNKTILNGIQAQRSAAAASVLAANNSIVVPNLYEQNEQAVNAIFLSVVATGTGAFTPAHVQTLTNITDQCPASGGNAVFKARSLLALATETELGYDDDANCGPSLLIGGNPGAVSMEPSSSNVQMYPNPGKDLLTLKWQDILGTEGQASLKDLTGRTVMVQAVDLEAGSIVLDLTRLQAGIYICEIQVDNKPVFAEKYVLIK